jgi:hypothetical protein
MRATNSRCACERRRIPLTSPFCAEPPLPVTIPERSTMQAE